MKREVSTFRREEWEEFLETGHCGISKFAARFSGKLAQVFNISVGRVKNLLEGTHIFGMNDYDREMFKIRVFQEQDAEGKWQVKSFDELSDASKQKAKILIEKPDSIAAHIIANHDGLRKYVFEFAMDECRFKGWIPGRNGAERQEIRLQDDFEVEFELKHHKEDRFDKNYEQSATGEITYGDIWPVLETVLRTQIAAIGRDNIVDINGQQVHGIHPWDFVNFVSKGERTFVYREALERKLGITLDTIDAERPGPVAYFPVISEEAPLAANDDHRERFNNPVPFRAALG